LLFVYYFFLVLFFDLKIITFLFIDRPSFFGFYFLTFGFNNL